MHQVFPVVLGRLHPLVMLGKGWSLAGKSHSRFSDSYEAGVSSLTY